ncbi:MAG TPA: hypothetical protein PKW15_06890 [Alphaproteobacteria bacterium]|nr:hypothetical protein [Alphaproteobacteria bacterium]
MEKPKIGKWKVARRVSHRFLTPDPFTNVFFDKFGTTRSMNQSFNLRNREFDRKYEAGEYDALKRQLEIHGPDCDI